MSKTLKLHFELDDKNVPQLAYTEYYPFGTEDGPHVARGQSGQRSSAGANADFRWHEGNYAFRAFSLLCIYQILSVRDGQSGFRLRRKQHFAATLGDAIRTSKPERACGWLLAVLGLKNAPSTVHGKANSAKHEHSVSDIQAELKGLFNLYCDRTEVAFDEESWKGADWQVFWGASKRIFQRSHLLALANAIVGTGKEFLPFDLSGGKNPFSLRLHVTGAGFLCAVESGDVLRKAGMLPLQPAASVKLHVQFPVPTHFLLYSFGPDKIVEAYVPQPHLAVGVPREDITLPEDLSPGEPTYRFHGKGGTESFLLLVGDGVLRDEHAQNVKERLQALVRGPTEIKLGNPSFVFTVQEELFSPEIRALKPKGHRFDNALEQLVENIRGEFAGQFASFSLLCAHRCDPS